MKGRVPWREVRQISARQNNNQENIIPVPCRCNRVSAIFRQIIP